MVKEINYKNIESEIVDWGMHHCRHIYEDSKGKRTLEPSEAARFEWEVLKHFAGKKDYSGEIDFSNFSNYISSINKREVDHIVYGAYENLGKYLRDGGHVHEFITGLSPTILTLCLLGGLENAKGKSILDLGCGSITSDADDGITLRDEIWFQPWLCRTLPIVGVNCYGVDAGNLEGETFPHYNLDLTKSNSLDVIHSNSMDAIVMHHLFPSIRLSEILYGDSLEVPSNSDGYTEAISKYIERTGKNNISSGDGLREFANRDKLYPILKPQLERILKPEGEIFIR